MIDSDLSLVLISLLSSVAVATGFLIFVPIFGEKILGMRLKAQVLVLLSATLYPGHYLIVSSNSCAGVSNFNILFSSVVVGLLSGWLLRKIVYVFQILGGVVAQVSSISFITGQGVTGEGEAALSQISLFAMLFMISLMDFHIYAIEVISSNDFICNGIGDFFTMKVLTASASSMMEAAFVLSAPVLGFSLMYNILIGLMNRAIPQLMVALIGAPFLVLASLVVFLISYPIALKYYLSNLVLL